MKRTADVMAAVTANIKKVRLQTVYTALTKALATFKPIFQPKMWTFFCFLEVNSELTDLSVSQGGQMTNLKGVVQNRRKNKSTAAF
jgi:hypothetical protein